ncbi:MAG: beta-lactamase family protein [Oceanicaulis sp.]|uniref:serine hydrolase domain-containing protein n=1 Tax=Glycocaulis sp. TaxID=1969725 RepID=UPI0025C2CB23|nr:serine hydrolase domain-containing protein [Glycocaulis sp.]MCC5981656.1 beta-lactamase family protein [Oceanicaulis sp.]MCH8520755.1 beta-lactamase family protein [Glycocaulis sp.]
MKRLLALIVLPLAVWAFGLPAAGATPFNAAQAQSAADAFAAALLEEGEAPGLAIAIARAGAPVLVRGYGYANLEHGVPVGEDTVFRIGSVTKQFTAAAILLLAEEGRLSLDDTVETYFPDFPRAEDITIRQLLQHTAGVSNYTSRDGFMADTAPLHHDRERMLAYIAAADPLYDFEPGTGWSYSNSGYILLDYIAEDAAGQPLADFLRERIFNPLGLNDTRMDDAAEILARRAQGYDSAEDTPSGFTNTAHLSLSVAAGAGAMRSTARDLALWMQALLDGEVVSPASLALMLEPARLKDGSLASSALENPPAALAGMNYGLGIMTGERDGRRFIGHGGSINGFNASLIHYPDEATTIVLLVNTIGPAARGAPVLAGAVLGGAAE